MPSARRIRRYFVAATRILRGSGKVTANRLLILYGASGTGKTSVLQAGVLPRLLKKRYAWVVARMVDAKPTAAIKVALVRECGVDAQFLAQPLLNVAQVATMPSGKRSCSSWTSLRSVFGATTGRSASDCMRSYGRVWDAAVSLHVVIALRDDTAAQQVPARRIQNIISNSIRLTRFSPAQASDAIVQPASG